MTAAPQPSPNFTPTNHPLRNVTPDPWMLRNARETALNIARVTEGMDLNRKDAR